MAELMLSDDESKRFADRLLKLVEKELQTRLSKAAKHLLSLSAEAWRDRTEVELSPALAKLDPHAREALGEALVRSALQDAHLTARREKTVRFQDLLPALSEGAKRIAGILDPRDKGF